jgi:hypothetical protein
MRRLTLAALLGALILSACTDQGRESPTEPTAPPSEALKTTCNVTPFPLVQVSALILKVFPNGKLRVEAVARAGAIALLWNTCHPTLAQKAAVDFINWMNLNSAKLIGTQDQRNTLINLILNGVGITATVPTGSPGDFGVGFFTPGNTLLVKTQNGTALVELDPNAFNEPTTIVVSRNPDDADLTNFEGNQFPPNFDYNAINASGNHVLNTGHPAIIAFCLLNSDFVTYPANRGIGHNPVAGAPGFPFEILDPVDLGAGGRSDLAAALNCGNLAPNTSIIIGGFGQGLPGFANAAWRTARQYLAPVAQALFLPEALHAATLGTLPPPIGGKAPSLSPFKVVEVSTNSLSFTTDPSTNNTSNGNYFKGVTIDECGDGCYPEVEILNEFGTRTGAGTNVTVSLIQTAGSGGVLGGTLTQPVTSFESGGTIFPQTAEFNDLTISAPGTYKLMFTAPGAASITSAEFKVYTMAFTVQPTAAAGGTVTENQFLGQTVAGFANPVVQVSIVDFANAVVTTANDQVEMAVTTGSLNGTTSVAANSGVASFTEIDASPIFQQGLTVGVEADETGVSLQASASYFGTNSVQATSTTFNVTNVPIN